MTCRAPQKVSFSPFDLQCKTCKKHAEICAYEFYKMPFLSATKFGARSFVKVACKEFSTVLSEQKCL